MRRVATASHENSQSGGTNHQPRYDASHDYPPNRLRSNRQTLAHLTGQRLRT
ncbi:hypothetical protein GCM10009872_50450 [Actinopolymorpha rutila]